MPSGSVPVTENAKSPREPIDGAFVTIVSVEVAPPKVGITLEGTKFQLESLGSPVVPRSMNGRPDVEDPATRVSVAT